MPSPLETDTRKGLSANGSTTSNKITAIETFRVMPRWLFVKVSTEKGIVGWGEATLEGHTEAVEAAFDDFRERFIGWEATNIEDICMCDVPIPSN